MRKRGERGFAVLRASVSAVWARSSAAASACASLFLLETVELAKPEEIMILLRMQYFSLVGAWRALQKYLSFLFIWHLLCCAGLWLRSQVSLSCYPTILENVLKYERTIIAGLLKLSVSKLFRRWATKFCLTGYLTGKCFFWEFISDFKTQFGLRSAVTSGDS